MFKAISIETRVSFFSWLLLIAMLVGSAATRAAETNVDRQLVDRVRDAVIKELRDSGALGREVDAGIGRAIERQRAAAQQRQRQQARANAQNLRPLDPKRDHVYGNPAAPISLIEYSDFECPFCKRFHPTAKRLVDESGGRINWVYRHFPLGFHNPAAQREAEAAECVAELGGNDDFWKYADALFSATASNGSGVSEARMIVLAKKLGLNGEAFQHCIKSGRHTARIQADIEEGRAVGVSGTPANYLRNNKTGKVVQRTGAQPIENMKAGVAELTQ